MWIYLWVNGQARGLRKVSGQPFIDRLEAWARKKQLDVVVEIVNR
jgi:hypothetical protein